MFHNLIRIIILVAGVIATTTYEASAYSASYYTPESQLAQGHWVKLDIDTTGVYEVSYEQLREWGFSAPEKVNVYGYGAVLGTEQKFDNSRPDDPHVTSTYHTTDGRMLFYGEGPVRAIMSSAERASVTRNVYDRAGHYFISDIPVEEQAYETRPYTPYSDPTKTIRDWHYSIQLVENDVQNVGEGGYIYHDRPMKAGEQFTIPFHVKDFGWSKSTAAKGIFAFQAGVNNPESITITMKLSSEIGNVSYSPQRCNSNTVPTRLFVTAQGSASFYSTLSKPLNDTHFTATLTIPEEFNGPYAAIDFGYIIYPRFNKLGAEGELSMYFRERDFRGQNFCVDDADSDVQIWNVTEPANVARYETSYDAATGRALFTMGNEIGAANQRLVAFNPSDKQRTPRYAGEVANQNLHGLETPYLLIVSTSSLYDAACDLAEIHRRYGHDVAVVRQEEVFNEFSSGTRTPAAIRRMAKMFYDRDPERIAHVLLYGASSWDNRFICSEERDLLPVFECEIYDQARDGATNYASDQYYGFVADNYDPQKIHSQPAQLSVGRIPVTDLYSAYEANRKVEQYFKTPPPASAILRALKLSDDGDNGIHFTHSELLVDTLLHNNSMMTVVRADNLLFPFTNGIAAEATAHISNTLTRGVGFFYYTGHGDSHSVTAEKLWTTSLIKSLTYAYPPVGMMSSCDAYPFDRHSGTLVECMTLQPEGGMIGTIGACRSVYLDHNKPLSLAVAEAYANAKPGTTGGDLLKDARNLLISRGISANLGYNTLCYNYCGDPALPLALPSFEIEGEGFGTDKVISGQPTKFTAQVTGVDGQVMSNYNGPALIEVYDSPIERSTIIRRSDDGKEKTVQCDENLLCELPVSVKDGLISTEIVLPEPAIEGQSYRVVVTAIDDTSELSAAGTFRGSSILSDGSSVTPETPRILALGLSSDSMTDDHNAKSDVVVQASIDPTSQGLAVGNSGIRTSMVLILDGKTRYTQARSMLTYDSEGIAHLSFPIKSLSFGRHTVTLRAAGNSGLADEASLTFTVGTSALSGTLTVENDEIPVREEAVFNLDAEGRASRIIIVNEKGVMVHSSTDVSFPYAWDLCDSNGRPVSDGIYRAWAIIESDIAYGATDKTEFIVLQK